MTDSGLKTTYGVIKLDTPLYNSYVKLLQAIDGAADNGECVGESAITSKIAANVFRKFRTNDCDRDDMNEEEEREIIRIQDLVTEKITRDGFDGILEFIDCLSISVSISYSVDGLTELILESGGTTDEVKEVTDLMARIAGGDWLT